MKNTTRTLDTLTARIAITAPSEKAVKELATEMMKDHPFTTLSEIKKIGGKFCKRHWILAFPWKEGIESEKFYSAEDATSAMFAYETQHAATIKAREILLFDRLTEKAEAILKETAQAQYEAKLKTQADAVARVTVASARRELSRM